jgi:hypothetical protein
MHHHPSNLTSERCIEAISYDHYGNATAPSTPLARALCILKTLST